MLVMSMPMKRIVFFASIFVVICAAKEQTNIVNNGAAAASSGEPHFVNGQIQDNIAAESIISSKLKRGATTTSTAGASNENQVQSSQINLGTSAPGGTAGVISYSTPNSYQQFYSPNFAAFSPIYAAAPAAATPQIWYVRAPQQQQLIQPSGVGTLKLTYTPNPAQPQTSIQYAATQPKTSYAAAPQQQSTAAASTATATAAAATYPQQFQLAFASQPAPSIAYAPALTLPYTTNPYTTATYTNAGQAAGAPVAAATLQQGQIIPYTAFQQFAYSPPTTTAPAAAYQPIPAAYTTAAPLLAKLGSTVVTPTAAAYYSAAPASHAYQQQPSFISAIHSAQPYQYTNAQKLVALPAYHPQQTQAYKTIVAPTTSTAASSYTAAYVQPTAIAPVKYIPQAQQQNSYYGSSASTAYAQKLAAYAPTNFVAASAAPPQAYHHLTPYNQQQYNTLSNNQALAINQLPQASNTNTAFHYGSQQLYSPAAFGKYSYTQIAAPQKYFYASQ